MTFHRNILSWLLIILWPALAWSVDEVTFRKNGREIQELGKLLVTAQDGGLLLLGRDGAINAIPPDELIKLGSDEMVPFTSFSREEMVKRLSAELPKNFKFENTKHYLICYDTSKTYALWCGTLFERLYLSFTNYWSQKGFALAEPEFPLVAIIFADKQSYLKYTKSDLGEAGESIIGYYHLATNRMTMYDLTGTASAGRAPATLSNAAQINQILAQPDALNTVSTIVHEATHQIAFNCGLHTRLSDCPVWSSEGIAVFFETPDLRNSKGWGGIGAVNRNRLEQFHKYWSHRPADSLKTLIADDKRFRDSKQSLDAYAEAWAMTYFLIKQHPKEYVAYLHMLSNKKPLLHDSPATRLEEFQKAFGDMNKLEVEFLRYMAHVR